jgi:C-terminal processing protease CtpA/Prc
MSFKDDGVRYYGKPVVALIGPQVYSSGEIISRLMRTAGIPLIGYQEYGEEGTRRYFSLPNGVIFNLPVAMIYYGDMTRVKGNGLVPDISIPVASSFDATRDYVLEAGIAKVVSMK